MPLKHPFCLPWPLAVGDGVPFWVMPSAIGGEADIGDFVGRPLVLCFLAGEPSAWESIAIALRDLHRDFQQAGPKLLEAFTQQRARLGGIQKQLTVGVSGGPQRVGGRRFSHDEPRCVLYLMTCAWRSDSQAAIGP